MNSHGKPYLTTLDDLQIIEKAGKNSLSMQFSGRMGDLVRLHEILVAEFPGSYIEKDRKGLRCVVPLSQDDNAPDAGQLVEKLIDHTHCQLAYHFTWASRPHGSKLAPELIMGIDRQHEKGSLYARIVMDIMLRRLDPDKTSDPMKNYTYERSPDGNAIIIRPRDEVCDTPEEAKHYCMVMISHFRHRFEESPHHIHISGLKFVPDDAENEGRDGHAPVPGKVVITLRGDIRELRLAQLAVAFEERIKSQIVSPDGNDDGPALQIAVDVNNDTPYGMAQAIGKVHMATGCRLPVTLVPGVFPRRAPSPVHGLPEVSFMPSIALLLNTPDTHYDEALIQALGFYTASFTKHGGDIYIPLVYNPFSGKDVINLHMPPPRSSCPSPTASLRKRSCGR